jgi:hypothetical protein
MFVVRDHKTGDRIVLEREAGPSHVGTRTSGMGVQERLDPPFAHHLNAGKDQRATCRALSSTVMRRMSSIGVVWHSHFVLQRVRVRPQVQVPIYPRKICIGPVFWNGTADSNSLLCCIGRLPPRAAGPAGIHDQCR